METPSLPTDSLYKMIAVGGLATMITGVAFLWKGVDLVGESSFVFAESSRALTAECKVLELRVKSVLAKSEKISSLVKAVDGKDPEPMVAKSDATPSKQPVDSMIESIELLSDARATWDRIDLDKIRKSDQETTDRIVAMGAEMEKINSEMVELLDRALETEAANRKFEWARKRGESLVRLADVFVPVGILLFLTGCFLWYNLTQKHQDAIIAMEAKKLKGQLPN